MLQSVLYQGYTLQQLCNAHCLFMMISPLHTVFAYPKYHHVECAFVTYQRQLWKVSVRLCCTSPQLQQRWLSGLAVCSLCRSPKPSFRSTTLLLMCLKVPKCKSGKASCTTSRSLTPAALSSEKMLFHISLNQPVGASKQASKQTGDTRLWTLYEHSRHPATSLVEANKLSRGLYYSVTLSAQQWVSNSGEGQRTDR